MAQDPSPGSQAWTVKTNTLPLFKQSPGEPCPELARVPATATAGTAAIRGHAPSCNIVPGRLKEEHSNNQAGNNLRISGVRLRGIQ